jgi:HSP20 family protein
MANPPARRQAPRLLPDLRDWVDVPWAPLLPFSPASMFRVEDYIKDNRYVVRAELPGMDPDSNIEITIEGQTLTIHAERREETKEAHRSEFRYGSFTRSVVLPGRADTEHVTAAYDKGILEISVPVPEEKAEGRRIAITKAG